MRRKRIHGLPTDEPQTDVSSLVDVSFLLLIFFLVTSTIMKRENDLPMTIPPPGQTSAIPTLPLWIEIAGDGTVSLRSAVVKPDGNVFLDERSDFALVSWDLAHMVIDGRVTLALIDADGTTGVQAPQIRSQFLTVSGQLDICTSGFVGANFPARFEEAMWSVGENAHLSLPRQLEHRIIFEYGRDHKVTRVMWSEVD